MNFLCQPARVNRRAPIEEIFFFCFRLSVHSHVVEPLTSKEIRRAVRAALDEDIGAGDVRIPMIAMTTRSSIRVKPGDFLRWFPPATRAVESLKHMLILVIWSG